jgi:hypothetical protein
VAGIGDAGYRMARLRAVLATNIVSRARFA